MDIEKAVFKQVLYFVNQFRITAGSDSFDIPRSMIAYMDITKNYVNEIYPLWYVQVNVPIWFYEKMAANHDNISVTLQLQYKLGEGEDLHKDKGTFNTEINGNFKAIIPYTTQIQNKDSKKVEQASDSYNKTYDISEYCMVEMMLYNRNGYNASFNSINTVITSATLSTGIAYCLLQAGVKNVLMDKGDNMRTYSELKILPGSTVKNILRLFKECHYYIDEGILFFDLDATYVLGDKTGCHAWRTNEYKSTQIVNIKESGEMFRNITGVYLDNREKSNVVVVSDAEITNYKLDDTSPKFKNSNFKDIIEIHTDSAVLSMFSPNKDFSVNLDSTYSKNINGKYRIYSVALMLTPSGEFLQPKFTIQLRK